MTSELGRSFSPDVIERIDHHLEVRIETRSGAGDVHRTVIWAVVDSGEVFIRSYNGATARWYREVLAGLEAAIWLGDERIPIRVTEATEAGDIARCSRVLQSKYAGDPATPQMVRPEILDTTLRVEPA